MPHAGRDGPDESLIAEDGSARLARVERDAVLRETERWFLKRGLPHFIAEYNAVQDIWVRALPVLVLLFLVEVAVNAPKREFPIWLDVVVVAAAYGALLVAWALANRARGRPPFAPPDDLGALEVGFFVVVPALVPLAVGGQVRDAVVTAAVNVVVLGVVYLATSYGLVPMTRWGAGTLVREIGAVVNLLVRALPLLLLFITFLFVNTEVWQVAAGLQWQAIAVVALLFAAVGIGFAVIRLPRQVGELSSFESWDRAEQRLRGTPLEAVLDQVDEPAGGTPPLSRRQWGNVGLVVLVSEGIQIALVAVLVYAFFVVFGLLAIEAAVVESWLGEAPDRLATFHMWGQELVLTRELLHVAAFLASFSGLYFTVVLLTDATYREEFLDEVVGDVHDAFAARAVYLAYLGAAGQGSATMPAT